MDLNNALARAQKLILDEGFNQKVEQIAKQRSGGGSSIRNSSNDLQNFEAAAFGTSYSNGNNDIELLQETPYQRSPKKSGFPKEVAESFSQMPPIGFEPQMVPPAFMYESKQAQRTPQAPTYVPQSAPSATIDYEYLKYIIDSSVKNALENQNDDAYIKGMRIKDGNIIQFLDTKGNVYEGVLKLKKKAK